MALLNDPSLPSNFLDDDSATDDATAPGDQLANHGDGIVVGRDSQVFTMFNLPDGIIGADPDHPDIVNGPIFNDPLQMGNQSLGQHSRVHEQAKGASAALIAIAIIYAWVRFKKWLRGLSAQFSRG